jgi:hypothetical protein
VAQGAGEQVANIRCQTEFGRTGKGRVRKPEESEEVIHQILNPIKLEGPSAEKRESQHITFLVILLSLFAVA